MACSTHDIVRHSDQACRYASIAFSLRRRDADDRPSLGSVGDANDKALCESFLAPLEYEPEVGWLGDRKTRHAETR